ncbi:type II toxin-antitoxin system RelE/ParE family toxin [Mesorhizobium sp. LHD-90]|uniref:type II toxin-antitoxin system RelE/ParE family toxin n=1 Tax=Mesorhizobium sp. LHD-90 TaxID=3071414 RepID=UPI0027E1DBCD|nr:type II toxin-antitoxin system RelE/ParE family toxin [Mesorhizobium sp. LHD-90]MDQ6436047.1 type II toxin-antitoxin system RelE/ParE family toxin [Mesorhizobium sp. LHD-90]
MEIVRTRRYLKDIKRLALTDLEIRTLEQEIAANPQAGAVVSGLGGIRKIRFGFGGRGKRGGGRAIYFLMLADDRAFMLFAYAKNEQEDLTQEQRRVALALIEEITNG